MLLPRPPDGNDATVPFRRNRLQWYESNMRRQASPPPNTQASRHAINYLDQLPVSTVRIRKIRKTPSEPTDADEPTRYVKF